MTELNPDKMPEHIAIIMDGNGRWAKKKGMMRVLGHQNAIKAVRDAAEGCAELNIPYLTLYAFSTENWQRPQNEVNALMNLLIKSIKSETPTLMKNRIRLRAIGDISQLPKDCITELQKTIEDTKDNDHMTLILALSYSSKWDIVNATKTIAQMVKENKISVDEIDENLISETLTTYKYPHPDLMIRTSGEMRISNFLLWELAYSELYFTEVLWPDFRKKNLIEAIEQYQKRDRRFGKVKETLVK
jgi:undecaprenyl diphosphate synthase